jgi:hypothetical protein
MAADILGRRLTAVAKRPPGGEFLNPKADLREVPTLPAGEQDHHILGRDHGGSK